MSLPERCIDLTPAQVLHALRSPVTMRALLSHMARIARPGTGASKILVPIGRMASNACDWVDGGLVVEIGGTARVTNIDVFVVGKSGRKPLFPRLVLEVPKDELVRAVKLAPRAVYPLKAKPGKDGVLLACDAEVVGSLAPPSFDVAEAGIRRSLPPKLRHSLPPVGSAESIDVSMPAVGEVALLKLLRSKDTRAPIELDNVDAGWDLEESSTTERRESKRPAREAPKTPSRSKSPSARPSRAPRKRSEAPSGPSRASRAPQPAARQPPPSVPRPNAKPPPSVPRPVAPRSPPLPSSAGRTPPAAAPRASKRPAARDPKS